MSADQRVCMLWVLLYCMDGVVSTIEVSCVFVQIHAVGNYFINQLLQSRHRGAFELAYAGFVKMTTVLWKYVLVADVTVDARWHCLSIPRSL